MHQALKQTWALGLILLAASCLLGQTPQPSDFIGTWKGEIETANLGFEATFEFAKDDWKGRLSIPVQGLKDRALKDIELKKAIFSFTITGIPGSPRFSGQLSEDGTTVKGSFLQGASKLVFKMTRADQAAADQLETLELIEKEIEELRKEWEVPGLAVGIVKDGKVYLSRGFGTRDQNQDHPVTPKTLFAIGSSTKAFTALALGTMVAEGKLDWDEPLRTYLPDFALSEESVAARLTPRDLLTHRSGMPRHDMIWYNRKDIDIEKIYHSLRHLDLSADLRETFQYNNLMFATAGHLSAVLDGTSWPKVVRSRLLNPLGMNNSHVLLVDAKKTGDIARPFDLRDDKITEIPYRNIDNVGPAGSIFSSADDMCQWLKLFVGRGKVDGKTIVSGAILKEVCSPQMVMGGLTGSNDIGPSSYGMGWMIDSYRGRQRIHHGGNIDGFSALVAHFPNDGFGVVALANRNATPLPDLLLMRIADRLLDLEVRDWSSEMMANKAKAKALEKKSEALVEGKRVEGTKPAQVLESYVGTYEHAAYGSIVVDLVANGDGLSVALNGLTADLEHWHYETFRALKNEEDPTLKGTKFLFRTNVDGDISELEVALEPAVAAIKFGRAPDAALSDPTYLARFVGEYKLGGQTISVDLAGKTLTVTVPGQPTYRLQPTRNDSFQLKEMKGYSLQFKSEGGRVNEVIFSQPQGMAAAKRARSEDAKTQSP
ncbi:MAG: serine hydrolase [Planctomycetota bacterium]